MFNQKFAVRVVYDRDSNVSTDEIRTWLRDKLKSEVKNVRFTIDNFGSNSFGRTFEGQLFMSSDHKIDATTLKSFIETPPDGRFRFEKIEKI